MRNIFNVKYFRVLSVALALIIDYSYYGFVTLSSFNFLYWNVLSQQSSYFGVEPLHYYVTLFLPELLLLLYPFLYIGIAIIIS